VKVSGNDVEKRGENFFLKGTDFQVESRAHKMSKSRGNVINPDDVVEQFGADSLRLYEMFMGPLEQVKPWSTKGVEGVNRFLSRAWRMIVGDQDEAALLSEDAETTPEQLKVLHEAIKKVTYDIDNMQFNTAISALMIFVNEARQWDALPPGIAKPFVKLLSPFAPHVAEELWAYLGSDQTIAYEEWPELNEEYLIEDFIVYPVQVNGKVRANIEVSADKAKDKEHVLGIAREQENIQKYLDGSTIIKEIFVPERIINFVVK
jgi:leucyl-tRNA synthetase